MKNAKYDVFYESGPLTTRTSKTIPRPHRCHVCGRGIVDDFITSEINRKLALPENKQNRLTLVI